MKSDECNKSQEYVSHCEQLANFVESVMKGLSLIRLNISIPHLCGHQSKTKRFLTSIDIISVPLMEALDGG